jgi:RNA-binding protein NOB1
MMCTQTFRARNVVVDTAALIKGVRLERFGQKLWTVQEVLDEVRDVKAREFLNSFPIEIKVVEPDTIDIQRVVSFARKTGDYSSLSAVDIRVLALTLMLEREHKGTEHLRDVPIISSLNTKAKSQVKDARAEKKKEPHPFTNEAEEDTETGGSANHDTEPLGEGTEAQQPWGEQDEREWDKVENEEKVSHQKMKEEQEEKEEKIQEKDKTQSDAMNGEPKGKSENEKEDEEEEGWITPNNIGRLRRSFGKGGWDREDQDEPVEVACLTADFAMQNVLLQMGLQVLSLEGLVIREVRTFVLRCVACFKVTKEMDRLFCPWCGNHSLRKVPYVVDAEGRVTLLLSARPPPIRGTRYSIPHRKGGRNNNDIILREDELPPTHRKKKETDLFDPDHHFLAPRKSLDKPLVIGFGKRNPNQSKRRVGKRKKNRGRLN